MELEKRAPALLEMLFGEAAVTAWVGASGRLVRWCQAMEGWLGELKVRYKPSTLKQARLAWKRLMQEKKRLPWELREADFEAHSAWMAGEGYSKATICNDLGYFTSFFRWQGEHDPDPECGKDFNPAAGVRRPRVRRYERAQLLSREEMEALLRMLSKDPSELGKRDTAFFLARLRTGAPLGDLQQLKWGQIEREAEGVWVRWREGEERTCLDEAVWEAVKAWLRAAGRWKGMRAEMYIFTPLAHPDRETTGGRREDWLEAQFLTSGELLRNLKMYGRRAGIREEALTLMALRRTAIRLKVEEGCSEEELRSFMGSREEAKARKYRLKLLPGLPAEDETGRRAVEAAEAPVRKARPFKRGENMKHGLYAISLPSEEVQKILDEKVEGMGEEAERLEQLGEMLLSWLGRANDREARRVGEAFSETALWLGKLTTMQEEMEQHERAAREQGGSLVENVNKMLKGMGKEILGEPWTETATSKDRMARTIASLRYFLRRAYRQATETEDLEEFLRLVEHYGRSCVRLGGLLRRELRKGSEAERLIQEAIFQAIREVTEELGLGEEQG